MIKLLEHDLWDDGRSSSKGNQLKWEKDGIWYKADYAGYEGLSEYVISHLLLKSSLDKDEFVLYDLEDISYKNNVFHGAKSPNLMYDDWQIITLERLFKNIYGESLYSVVFRISKHENRLKMIVEQTERMTGLQEFGIYFSKMLTIDALFLNEDRHTHNIAILVNGQGKYRLCPFFDHGAGLLSDTTMDYPLGCDVYSLMESVKAKTFSDDFAEQMEIAETLYGEHIKFNFTKADVDDILDGVDSSMYGKDITNRVREILYQQMRKYAYLFKS